MTGEATGSYCNFTCDRYFERVGKEKLSCIDGVWEYESPFCVLSASLCQIKPPGYVNGAKLISLSSSSVTKELSFEVKEYINVYNVASYSCPGNKFENFKDNEILYQAVKNKKIGYVNVACIGKNKWSKMPKCLT